MAMIDLLKRLVTADVKDFLRNELCASKARLKLNFVMVMMTATKMIRTKVQEHHYDVRYFYQLEKDF